MFCSFAQEKVEKNQQQLNLKESNTNRENMELREKIADQAEQIEVLIIIDKIVMIFLFRF